MRPRARIAVWPAVVLVAVLLLGFIVVDLLTPKPPAPAPTPTPVLPSPTSAPAAVPPGPTATAANTSAQSVSGSWSGTLVEPGAPVSNYAFSMTLTEATTGTVSGTARAQIPSQAQYYVVESLTGQVSGGVFTFQRTNTLETGSPSQRWCIDSGQLTLSPDGSTLTGTWQGQGCGSGPISVARVAGSPSAQPSG